MRARTSFITFSCVCRACLLSSPHHQAISLMASRLTLQRRHRPRSAVAPLSVLRGIKLLATDVDGVLTDAGMYYSESGDEWKKFNTRDGMGIKLLQKAGLITAIVTQERTKLVARRAEKLAIPELHQGIFDKLTLIREMAD